MIFLDEAPRWSSGPLKTPSAVGMHAIKTSFALSDYEFLEIINSYDVQQEASVDFEHT